MKPMSSIYLPRVSIAFGNYNRKEGKIFQSGEIIQGKLELLFEQDSNEIENLDITIKGTEYILWEGVYDSKVFYEESFPIRLDEDDEFSILSPKALKKRECEGGWKRWIKQWLGSDMTSKQTFNFSAGTEASQLFNIPLKGNLPSTMHLSDGSTNMIRAGVVYELSFGANNHSHILYTTRIQVKGSVHGFDEWSPHPKGEEEEAQPLRLMKRSMNGVWSSISCETLPDHRMFFIPGSSFPIYNLTYKNCSSYAIHLIKRTTFMFPSLPDYQETEKIVFSCSGEIHIRGGTHCVLFRIPNSTLETISYTQHYTPTFFHVQYVIQIVGLHQLLPDLILEFPILLYHSLSYYDGPPSLQALQSKVPLNDDRYPGLTASWDNIQPDDPLSPSAIVQPSDNIFSNVMSSFQ